MNEAFDYHRLLGYQTRKSMTFSEFLEACERDPANALRTSSALISEAIKFFGFDIVVRSGEPTIEYKIFKDPFCKGLNAVFGQEFSIKQLVDVIEQVGKESGPNRGIVLVGPPASGKTNIVDLIALALEEYTKRGDVHIYSFYFRLASDTGQQLEIRSPFLRNPVLLLPTIVQQQDGVSRPREAFFSYLRERCGPQLHIPTYYHDASLDKRSMEILQALLDNPQNREQNLSGIIDEYVRVEEVVFSNAQGRGVANIDDLNELRVRPIPMHIGEEWRSLLSEHLPGLHLVTYDGALVAANRGLLHIHDAFAAGTDVGPSQETYKPLLMLLGSGKASVEATQVSIDTTVVITTNVEEMAGLERQLTSEKLLDRVEKIPVNYLMDCTSEMDILRRDLSNIDERYDVDPNLLPLASYYAVLTRLLPPLGRKLPESWSSEKQTLYRNITPEQKLFIFANQAEDPVKTIEKLPFWHPFRNLAFKLGINIYDPDSYRDLIAQREDRITLESCGLFRAGELALIDDEFMRQLLLEHYPKEGQYGISVRQMQNIMRNTLASSDGQKVHVGTFLSQLKRVFREGESVHHWLGIKDEYTIREGSIGPRKIGAVSLAEGEGDFGDFRGLLEVLRALYYQIIAREITAATVNRDPAEMEFDLRRYLQHALLFRAVQNRAFAHVMVPKFSYVDNKTGLKVEAPNLALLSSLESVLVGSNDPLPFRDEIAQRFLRLQDTKEICIEPGKSIVASRNDNVLEHFRREYQQLLSHRKTVEGLDHEALTLAFVHKRNKPAQYDQAPYEVRELAEQILTNMTTRFGYSRALGLDTFVFALRKGVIDFASILR